MEKSILEFSPSNIDFMYVVQHILYADYVYKKTVFSNGITSKNIDQYLRLTETYVKNKLSSFNADILSEKLSYSKNNYSVKYNIKIFPSYYYQIILPLDRFTLKVQYIDQSNNNSVILDVEYLRYEMMKDFKIKKHEAIELPSKKEPKPKKAINKEPLIKYTPKDNIKKPKKKPKSFKKFKIY